MAPEHVVLAQDAIERAMASGTAYPQEGDWLTGDGERRRVAMRNTVLTDDDGLPYGIACVGLDVTDDRRREELLHQRAQTDLLTGIANRGALFDALHRRLEEGPGCALLFCDLDRFKEVNDDHGHAVGDRILAEVGRAAGRGPGRETWSRGWAATSSSSSARPRKKAGLVELVERVDRGGPLGRSPGRQGPLSLGVSIGIAIGQAGGVR